MSGKTIVTTGWPIRHSFMKPLGRFWVAPRVAWVSKDTLTFEAVPNRKYVKVFISSLEKDWQLPLEGAIDILNPKIRYYSKEDFDANFEVVTELSRIAVIPMDSYNLSCKLYYPNLAFTHPHLFK